MTDKREEWEKDRWDIRVLHDKYGINYNKSKTQYYLDFTKIEQVNMREQIKKYIKQRLISKNHFSWGTAKLSYIFYQCFSLLYFHRTNMDDLKGLKRTHIEKYIQWLHEYAKNNLKKRMRILKDIYQSH